MAFKRSFDYCDGSKKNHNECKNNDDDNSYYTKVIKNVYKKYNIPIPKENERGSHKPRCQSKQYRKPCPPCDPCPPCPCPPCPPCPPPVNCVKTFTNNPTPIIYLSDLTNFDDTIALILLAKAPNIDLRLVVVDYGFDNVGPAINNVFNILAWIRDRKTPVIRGNYFAPEEVAAGPYPEFGLDATTFNPARAGQVAQPIYNMYVPPLWKENGSTLYGTVGQIPLNNDPNRQYSSVSPEVSPFVPAEEQIRSSLIQIQTEGKQALIINTGPMTVLGRFLSMYGNELSSAIQRIIIMGGGFFNFSGLAPPADRNSQRWAGNIFSDPSFYLSPLTPFPPPNPTLAPPPGYQFTDPTDWATKPPFQTMQEFNVFLDPVGAKTVFDFVYANGIDVTLVPTDATDPTQIGSDIIDQLKLSPTFEGQYVADLLEGVRNFEGSGFDIVIRLWDILATLTILNPEIVDVSQNRNGSVDVIQLGSIDALQRFKCNNPDGNPFHVIKFNPYVGQTKFTADPTSSITIVFRINGDLAKQILVQRLNDPLNTACSPTNY